MFLSNLSCLDRDAPLLQVVLKVAMDAVPAQTKLL